MAEIVIGIASSHTPQISSGWDMWTDHAERDRRNPLLLGKDAEYHTYDELLAAADPGLEQELSQDVWEAKYARCQDAIEVLAGQLREAAPDIAVVIGDDQRELFRDDGTPAFACYLGEYLTDMPPAPEALARMPAGIRAASWATHAEQPQRHPVATEFSRLLAEHLTEADFDITVFAEQPAGRTLGHAFTFPRYRLGLPAQTPVAPVFVNTYYPPNVPSAARCLAVGQAIRDVVEAWDSDTRVAVIASGGLSHFVVDEELDNKVLSGIVEGNTGVLGSLSRAQLRSGNSEILNWVTAVGALEGKQATVVDYVPGYRTPAGTGAGMAFVHWH